MTAARLLLYVKCWGSPRKPTEARWLFPAFFKFCVDLFPPFLTTFDVLRWLSAIFVFVYVSAVQNAVTFFLGGGEHKSHSYDSIAAVKKCPTCFTFVVKSNKTKKLIEKINSTVNIFQLKAFNYLFYHKKLFFVYYIDKRNQELILKILKLNWRLSVRILT
jgi:hypothetical protein